jgi:hypothetical protein
MFAAGGGERLPQGNPKRKQHLTRKEVIDVLLSEAFAQPIENQPLEKNSGNMDRSMSANLMKQMNNIVPKERQTSKRSGLESGTGKDFYIDLEQYTE